jgi:hypothetical protein
MTILTKVAHAALALALAVHAGAAAPASVGPTAAEQKVLKVHVTLEDNSPIGFRWPETGIDAKFLIYRMTEDPIGKPHNTWGPPVAVLPPGSSHWTDVDVEAGRVYEYAIANGSKKFAFLAAGTRIPLIEDRGVLLLIVDASHAAELATELGRLRDDLVGDGWRVVRHDVARDASSQAVKQFILSECHARPGEVKAVFLLGRVPVPYSGGVQVDGHPDHRGAWPADGYYGDIDGVWTDERINDTSSARPENHNIPGDGKFDQERIPTGSELMVGRVDLSNMPVFGKREGLLLKQYLDKNHSFRHDGYDVPRQALIFDDWKRTDFAMTGWMLTSTLGPDAVQEGEWKDLSLSPRLWAYGTAGGWYEGAGKIGTSRDYAKRTFRAIFQGLFGSYFGDWDSKDNLLRAPLAMRTYGLASFWAGRPNWYFHHMAVGRPIGYAYLTATNPTPYLPSPGLGGVHIALMGDPTLRMDYFTPPDSVACVRNASGVRVTWTPSPAESVIGYHVYRAPDMETPFKRLNDAPITEPSFTDTAAPASEVVYMVRALRLEVHSTASYYNAGQGVFAPCPAVE